MPKPFVLSLVSIEPFDLALGFVDADALQACTS